MGIFEAIVVFVCSWWLIFLPMLSAGTRSQHESDNVVPGTERAAPVTISWRWKFIVPTVGAVLCNTMWLRFCIKRRAVYPPQ